MEDEDGYYTEIIKRQPGGTDSTDTTYWNKDWNYYVNGLFFLFSIYFINIIFF